MKNIAKLIAKRPNKTDREHSSDFTAQIYSKCINFNFIC